MKILTKICIGILFSFSVYSGNLNNLRGERYCEILLYQGKNTFAVYNTIKLNDCPQAIWRHITEERIKEETHSKLVHLNGPRYWMIDAMENTQLLNPTIRDLGGLKMRLAGILRLSVKDILTAGPYQTHVVERKTTWIYDANKPVYELIDSEKNVYVMQSYSTQKIGQTQDSLAELGSHLTLPKGWYFKTGLLKQQASVTAENQQAVVVQDNYLNTYQKASQDLLN